ncbi:hypothetical protein AgCh_005501 [Apium graveolens]
MQLRLIDPDDNTGKDEVLPMNKDSFPRSFTGAQPAATPHPYPKKVQEQHRTEPPAHRSYHLALEGGAFHPWVSVPLDSSSSANS